MNRVRLLVCAFTLLAAAQPHPRYTIAFKSFAPNNSDVFLADADGTHARPLVPDPALDYNASFSADAVGAVDPHHRELAVGLERRAHEVPGRR